MSVLQSAQQLPTMSTAGAVPGAQAFAQLDVATQEAVAAWAAPSPSNIQKLTQFYEAARTKFGLLPTASDEELAEAITAEATRAKYGLLATASGAELDEAIATAAEQFAAAKLAAAHELSNFQKLKKFYETYAPEKTAAQVLPSLSFVPLT